MKNKIDLTLFSIEYRRLDKVLPKRRSLPPQIIKSQLKELAEKKYIEIIDIKGILDNPGQPFDPTEISVRLTVTGTEAIM